MVILGHIAGLPVQESLAYVAPVIVVVAWIYWAGRRERRRIDAQPPAADPADAELDQLLAPEPTPERSPSLVANPDTRR